MMTPNLFLVEIVVANWTRSVDWYRDALGMNLALIDEPNQFALLRGTGNGQLALKGGSGQPSPAAVRLHFFQPNLDEMLLRLSQKGILPDGPPRLSHEGYRSVTLSDPDGYRVYLFEWVCATPS